MIGGKDEVVEKMRPIFETLAPAADKGWGRVGPHGAGHFVKMIHNGIEYGMMQALAEGFNIMKTKKEFDLNLDEIAEIWRYGSVVRSWLLDLTARALKDDPALSDIQPRRQGRQGSLKESSWHSRAASSRVYPAGQRRRGKSAERCRARSVPRRAFQPARAPDGRLARTTIAR